MAFIFQPASGLGRRSSYYINPQDRAQLESSILDKGLSSAVWLGETLDKVDRPFRQLVAEGASWFTGKEHDFNWSEMLAWVPFSDTLGLTDPNNIATGRDITGYDDPNTIWDGIVNFGTEVLASPTTYLSGGLAAGAKSALSPGGKALKKMGLLDESLELLGRQGSGLLDGGRKLTDTGGLLPRATKTKNTVADALDVMKDRVRRDAGYSTKEGIRAADNLERGFRSRLGDSALDKNTYEGILDSPIGGLWELHGPFGLGGGGVTFGSERVAEWVDRTWDAISYAPGIKHMTTILNKKFGGTFTRLGRWAAQRGYKALDEAMVDGYKRLAKSKIAFEAIGEFDVDNIVKKYGVDADEAAEKVMNNHLDVIRYLESRSEEGLQFSLPSHLETLKPELDYMKDVIGGLREEALTRGIRVPELNDLFISYFPRELNTLDGTGDSLFGPILKTSFRNQQARRDYLRSLPGGTAQLVEMAMNPQISGLGKRLQMGRVTKGGQLSPPSERAAAGEALNPYAAGAQLVTAEGSRMVRQNELNSLIVQKIKEEYPEFVENLRSGHMVRSDIETMGAIEEVTEGVFEKQEVPLRPLTNDELDDTLAGLASWLNNLDPKYADEKIPVFKVDPLESFSNYAQHISRSIASADAIQNMFAHMARPARELMASDSDWIYIDDALDMMPGFDQGSGQHLRRFVRELEAPENIPTAEGARATLGPKVPRSSWKTSWMKNYLGGSYKSKGDALAIPKEVFEDAKRLMESFNPDLNEGVQWWASAMARLQDAWRAGVTKLWPKFWSRNFLGGQTNNFFKDAHDPRYGKLDIRRWTAPLKDTNNILRGAPLEDLQKIPGFEDLTDEEATQEVMNLLFAHRIFSPNELGIAGSAADLEIMDTILTVKDADNVGGSLSPLASTFTKAVKETRQMGAAPLMSPKGALEQLTPYGLLRGRGAFGPKGGRIDAPPAGDKMFAAAFGGQMSNLVEGFNRISPFVAYLRQGFDPSVAARKVFEAQVDYRNLSRFERKYLRGIFPFYSFTRGMVPFVIMDFLENRGGKMAWTLRGIGGVQSGDPEMEAAPEWIRRSTGLPVIGGVLESILGTPQGEGATRFIRGAGVPFEDVVSLIGSGGQTPMENVSDTLSAVAGRMSPLLKAPLEMMTKQSFFHQRPLRDLESRYANIFTDRKLQRMPILDQVLDLVPGVSKMAQLVGRTKDPRKRFDWAQSLTGGGGDGYTMSGLLSGVAGEFLPWSYSDYTTGLSRQYNVMTGVKQRLELQPYIKFFGDRPYISDDILPHKDPTPQEKAAALQRMYPEQYKLLAAYNQITQEVRK